MAEARRVRELAFRALFQMDAIGFEVGEEVDRVRAALGAARREASDEGGGGGEDWDAMGEAGVTGLDRATGAEVERGVACAAEAFGRRRAADAELDGLSPGWPARRRPAVDRALLRLGWYELRETGAPAAAVINELVELAKRYSTDRSPGFVNAVLDEIRKRVEGGGGDGGGVSGGDEVEAGSGGAGAEV